MKRGIELREERSLKSVVFAVFMTYIYKSQLTVFEGVKKDIEAMFTLKKNHEVPARRTGPRERACESEGRERLKKCLSSSTIDCTDMWGRRSLQPEGCPRPLAPGSSANMPSCAK